MHFGWTGVLAAALVGATSAGACSSSSPTDQNLGTNLGADFVAPVIDAASDSTADVPISSGAGGAAGTTGSTGSAGTDGTAGSGGAAGQAGVAGADGAGGAAGSGGAGTGS